MANRTKQQKDKVKTNGVGLPEYQWDAVETAWQSQGLSSRNAWFRQAVDYALNRKAGKDEYSEVTKAQYDEMIKAAHEKVVKGQAQ